MRGKAAKSPKVASIALRERLVATALDSPEFRSVLSSAIHEIRASGNPSATEATIAGRFERVLYTAFRDAGLSFDPDKEESVTLTRHVGRGRIDSRIGRVIIEYKKPSAFQTPAQVRKGTRQLEDYLLSITKDSLEPVYGFLTDGNHCIELRALRGIITSESPKQLLNIEALLRLAKAVNALGLPALSAANLIRDFCSPGGGEILYDAARTFRTVLQDRRTPRTEMLQAEWLEIFRLGHDDVSQQRRIDERRRALGTVFNASLDDPTSEYTALFALHTAYAVIVKLMAYRVVSELHLGRQLTTWSEQLTGESQALRAFCAQLEDGEIFRQLNILNLLEGDFFSWYAAPEQWDESISRSIRAVLEVLGRYEQAQDLFASAGAMDLFRDLYEAAVPAPVRSSFGEFYTPHWLATHVIESAKPDMNARFLDPCCGSGTFLVAAIERVRNENPSTPPGELLDAITERVVGIDLNPLAVLTARVNYFIHIADLIPEELAYLTLPVFLGDASYVPLVVTKNGTTLLQYRISTLKGPIDVSVPMSLVENTAHFATVMTAFESAVRAQDPAAASKILNVALPHEDRTDMASEGIEALTKQLVDLEKNHWNGIWARIIANFLSTAAIGRFDVIVGNPPWVDWKNLPTGYRERVKGLCIDRGLFSGDGRTGGINLNICALISHVAAENWLTRKGRLAFLMPKELSVQQSYQGWRRLSTSTPRSFKHFVDWTTAGHPFDPVKEDFMTYVIGPAGNRPHVPVTSMVKARGDRSKASDWLSWEEASAHLNQQRTVAGQIIPNSTAFTFASSADELNNFELVAGECAYIGREGIEFYPQEIQLFRYEGPGPKAGTAFVRNIQVTKSKYKIPSKSRMLETKYLHPVVKGPRIKPFLHDYDGLLVAFPYDSDDPHRPLTKARLRAESPLLLAYYEEFRALIEAQTGFSDKIRGVDAGEYYGLARTGPYSFADMYVCFRDNTKWCTAVVSSEPVPWGDNRRVLFQNHAVSMCERADGTFITEDEAFYICAILNTPAVRSFIYASSDQRSYKIRPPVYVPLYDPANKRHVRLSRLGRAAHDNPEDVEASTIEMQRLYLQMCLQK